MALKPRRSLGIMLSAHAVTVAELRLSPGDRPSLQTLTTLRLDQDQDLSWDHPEKIGAALAQHLRQAEIKTRHAILGLPAAWVLTRSITLPPADGETLRKLVANKAERAFANGGRDLTIDFVPPRRRSSDALGQQSVLLVAAQRQRVDAALKLAEAAGLTTQAITATTAVVAATTLAADESAAPARSFTLLLNREAPELAVCTGSTLHGIRPLRRLSSNQGDPANAIAAQLRQVRVLEGDAATADPTAPNAAANGDGDSSGAGLWLWDAIGLDADARSEIAEEAGAGQLHNGTLDQWVHVNGAVSALTEPQATGRYVGPVALARSAIDAERLPIDWLHSRLAEPRQQRLSQPRRLAIAAAVLVLALVGGFTMHYRGIASEVATLEAQLADMQTDLETAQQVITRVDNAETWFADRPSALACLEALTLAFGESPDVWATEISLDETMSGTVAGVATDSQTVLEVRDRLHASPAFANVASLYMRESDRSTGGHIGWAIAFDFNPATAQPHPAESDQ